MAHALALPAAVAGALFAAALAVVLGQATGSPKPFVGLLLALWYVAMNDKGRTAGARPRGLRRGRHAGVDRRAGWPLAALLAAGVLLLERFRRSRA